MRGYLAQIAMTMRLTLRDRSVVFFNYLFPMIFFFMFAGLYKAERGGAIVQVVTMVLTIGTLGAGFFGAGMRAVMEREANILRRFKVAPITPMPILVSSLVAGILTFLPLVALVLGIAIFYYKMPVPANLLSLLLFIAIGVVAFRAMGMLIASVVNSMAESQIVIQLLYFPMLMLSGATIPLSVLPKWLQIIAQFLPSTHFYTGMQSILLQKENLIENALPTAALLLTTVVATFLGMKLFRWEKDEKLPASSKAWIAAVLAPFVLLGVQQAYKQDNLDKIKIFERASRRNRSTLIKGARVVVGDGTVIEQASVLVRDGKIAEIYTDPNVTGDQAKAETIEAAGKTLLPGLIDLHVHLGAPGGMVKPEEMKPEKSVPRALASYLYSGVTLVRTVGDALDQMLDLRRRVDAGNWQGAAVFVSTPMFTAEKGHGTEYFKDLPENVRKMAEEQMVRVPKSADEARAMVKELKQRGVDGIKVILEAGMPGMLFNRMDVQIFKAIVEEAKAQGLPVACHTGDSADVREAVAAGVTSIEHGSTRDRIPDELFAEMKAKGIAYVPTLSVMDAMRQFQEGKTELLDRSLLQQAAPPEVLRSTKAFLQNRGAAKTGMPIEYDVAVDNLKRAAAAGVLIAVGSDAGNPLVVHGPTVQREMQLWVEAGLEPGAALQGATGNAAKVLRADSRIGLVKKGYEATLLVVDGNPLKEIQAAERISSVMFKGERVVRAELFEQEK